MSFDISELFDKYKDKVHEEKVAENVLEFIQQEKEYLEEQILYFMEVSGITELSFDDDIISFKVEAFPNVLVDNYTKLKTFLGEDEKDVFSETPSKLKSYVNKMIDGDKVIPDFVRIFLKPIVKFKEAKKDKKKKGR